MKRNIGCSVQVRWLACSHERSLIYAHQSSTTAIFYSLVKCSFCGAPMIRGYGLGCSNQNMHDLQLPAGVRQMAIYSTLLGRLGKGLDKADNSRMNRTGFVRNDG